MAVGKFLRDSATLQASGLELSHISSASSDSFNKIHLGFDFGPNGLAFYPHISFFCEHNKHEFAFSIALVSSFGSVINNDIPDPFGYSHHSRQLPEYMSMSGHNIFEPLF